MGCVFIICIIDYAQPSFKVIQEEEGSCDNRRCWDSGGVMKHFHMSHQDWQFFECVLALSTLVDFWGRDSTLCLVLLTLHWLQSWLSLRYLVMVWDRFGNYRPRDDDA